MKINLKKSFDLAGLALYNYRYKEGGEWAPTKTGKAMQDNKDTKKVRPTKKALINDIIAKGVEPKIAQSLSRANIEALQMVLKLLS